MMAGGTITRISLGNSITDVENNFEGFYNNLTMNAGEQNRFVAKTTNYGSPKARRLDYEYFVRGWWTDYNGKEIKEAQLGDKVQFHIKMKNIQSPKGKKVNLELREWDEFDFLLYILSFTNKELIGYKNTKEYEKINIVSTSPESKEMLTDWELNENAEIVVPLLLDEDALAKMMANDAGRDLELYFRCRYINENNLPEIADLPWEEWNYLKVKPKPVVEPIIFVHASNEHLLPAIYSAQDGSPWYVAAFKNGMYANKYNTLSKPYDLGGKKELTFFEKKAYIIAIRKLEKGELIFNTGRKGTTSRFYEYDIVYIDGKFKDKIKMGVNRGTGIVGETSRGINQIEAQSQRGVAGTIKTVGEIAGIFGVLADLASLLRGVADHQIPMPSIVPPFVTDIVNRMKAENDEFVIEQWNQQLQKEVTKGREELELFFEKHDGINKTYNLGFKIINLSAELLEEILRKEISEYDKSSVDFESFIINKSQGKKDASLLTQSIEEMDKFNRPTINHYIHAVYVKDLEI